MGKLATDLTAKIQMVLSKLGGVTFKNPRGMVTLKSGGKFRYGVGPNGASDLIGYKKLIITPEMVGRKMAQFMVIEVKAGDDVARKNQNTFVEAVVNDGGRGGIARSEAEAISILNAPG